MSVMRGRTRRAAGEADTVGGIEIAAGGSAVGEALLLQLDRSIGRDASRWAGG
jgi:hypothetical protein